MENNQVQIVSNHGGSRRGSGRKRFGLDDKWLKARGISPLSAAEVMSWHGEQKGWNRLLNSQDDRVFLQAWMFLVQMRDGRPAQQINMTSTSISLSASDLERARAIVAEIRSSSHEPQVITSAQKGLSALDSAARLGEGGAK